MAPTFAFLLVLLAAVTAQGVDEISGVTTSSALLPSERNVSAAASAEQAPQTPQQQQVHLGPPLIPTLPAYQQQVDFQQKLQRLQEQRKLCARCDCYALRKGGRVSLDENLDDVKNPRDVGNARDDGVATTTTVPSQNQVLVINCTSRLRPEELTGWAWPARLSAGEAVAAETWVELRGGDMSGVSRLPALPFRLTRLSLADNRLRVVATRAFANLAALAHLDLGRNVIAEIPSDAFLGLASLERLDLSRNNLSSKHLSPDLFKKQDKLATVTLAHNKLDGELNGDTLPWSASIQDLDLSYNGFTSVSAGAWNRMSSLKVLDLSNNKLASLTPNAFAELGSLERLDLSRNALVALPPAALAGLAALRSLSLAHNDLRVIPAPTFEALASLAQLDLSWNALSAESAGLGALGALPGSLRSLDASHNPLGLAEGGLEGRQESGAPLPPGLEELSLESCGLHELDVRAWGGLRALRRLQLAGNGVSVLSDLARLDALAELNVSSNALTRFPTVDLPGLRTLDVSHNQLERAPAPISPRLAVLLLDDNPMEELLVTAPASLALLSAQHMPQLRKLPSGALRLDQDGRADNDSACLQLLLGHNSALSEVHENAFDGVRLCQLNLSHNALQWLPSKLTNWSALAVLDLQGNPWTCSCRLQWMLDSVVRQLYTTSPAVLDDLRCAGPEHATGRRLVHWFNHTGRALCDGELMGLQEGGKVTFRMSSASLGVMTSLGIVAIGLVVLGILAHRKYISRRRARNRRL